MAGGSTSWRSKKQGVVALSTAEAEYVELASATQEALWIRLLMTELKGQPPETGTLIFEDNQSAIAMTKNLQYHGRSKHVSIKFNFIRDQVSKGSVHVIYCPSSSWHASWRIDKRTSERSFCEATRENGTHQVFWRVRRSDGTVHSTRTQFNVLL